MHVINLLQLMKTLAHACMVAREHNRSSYNYTYFLKEREHPQSDDILPQIISHFHDESHWVCCQGCRVDVQHLQKNGFLQLIKTCMHAWLCIGNHARCVPHLTD